MLNFLQCATRASLKIPLIEKVAWKVVPRFRRLAGKFYGGRSFVTVFDDNLKMRIKLDSHIESQIFWQGVCRFDRGEVALLKDLLKPGFVFFDVGANVGVFTLLAAKRVGEGAVHSFEPSEQHCGKLKKNLQLNAFGNVILNQCAVSRETKTKMLYVPKSDNTGRASLYSTNFDAEECSVEEVSTIRLDDYVKDRNIKRLDLIKIDVEGAELEVLEGGVETLRKLRPKVMMELDLELQRHAGRSPEEVWDFWTKVGYKIGRIRNDATVVPIKSVGDLLSVQNIFCVWKNDELGNR